MYIPYSGVQNTLGLVLTRARSGMNGAFYSPEPEELSGALLCVRSGKKGNKCSSGGLGKRSFAFFIKERSVLCFLLHSL